MLGLGTKKPRKKKGDNAAADLVETVTVAEAEPPTQPAAPKGEAEPVTHAVAMSVAEPVSVAVPVVEPTTPSMMTAEPVAAQQENDTKSDKAPRGLFRSWVNDTDRGYSRLVDEEHNRLVVQFQQRPPTDVTIALKDGGFRFQPDYRGQKNAWVRRNDFEGRIQVEAMEKLFRELVPGKESPDR